MTTELQKRASLWAIIDDVQALFDSLEGLDESSPSFAACKADLDAQVEAAIRKVSGIHAFRAHALAMAHRCDVLQGEYLAARLSWEKTVERLEEYVKSVMEHSGKKELEGEDGLRIKLKANPASVIIVDEAQIPNDYKELVTPEPYEKIVKAKIAKALKAGVDVPGADLNISSTRLDWGDPPKKKGGVPQIEWEHLPEVKGELE
jgi:hypothetical protein